jgi:hypothetical protein
MKTKSIVGWALIGIGSYDLLLGESSTPLPIIGDYLTQQLDAVFIVAGLALLFVIK